VALRVLLHEVPFSTAEDLTPWAATAARRLHTDSTRARARCSPDELSAAIPAGGPELSDVIEWRAAWSEVARHVALLDPTKRVALLAGVDGARGGAEPGRVAVMRHRTRKSLRSVEAVRRALHGLLGVCGVVATSLRRWRPSAALATSAAASIALVTALWGYSPGGAISPEVPGTGPQADTVSVDSANASAQRRAQPRSRTAVAAPVVLSPYPRPSDKPLDVNPVPGSGVRVRETPRPENARLICVKDLPVTGDVCTPT
jgi:hypothetical protein